MHNDTEEEGNINIDVEDTSSDLVDALFSLMDEEESSLDHPWEYACESCSVRDSVFKRRLPIY